MVKRWAMDLAGGEALVITGQLLDTVTHRHTVNTVEFP